MDYKLTRDKYLLHDEFERLLAAIRASGSANMLRDYTMFLVCGQAGLRVSELVALRRRDALLDVQPAILRVRTLKQRKKDTKGRVLPPRKPDEIALPATAARTLRAYISKHKTIGYEDRLFALNRWKVWKLFKQYARAAKLNPRYSPHSLRHYRGLRVYDETKDLQLTRETLRHASLSSTEVYVHSINQLKRAAAVDM